MASGLRWGCGRYRTRRRRMFWRSWAMGCSSLACPPSCGTCAASGHGGRWHESGSTSTRCSAASTASDGLRCGDAVLLADGGILHPPALVLDLDPGSWTWSEDDDLLVEATVLLDRSHEPVELWTLPRVLLEAATWSTGAVRAEMRGCLLDLWGLDLTCPRCAGRGGAIQFGMRGRPPSASNPDEEPILGGCVIEPFMHRYTCRFCHTQWGGAPRFADPVLLDLARSGGVLRDEEIRADGSTPMALRWLNTLFDGVEDLLDQWQPYRLFTEFDSRYGRTVGVDLQCGDDALELEYKPDGSAVSGWDLRIQTEGEPPPVSFTLTPGGRSGAQAIKDVGLFTRRAILLGWNPSRCDDWDPPYEEWVDRTGGGEVRAGRWSVANRRHIAPGTEVFLLLQGAQHGLVGHGITTDWPAPDESLDDPDKTTQYVPVEWDRLLPVESRISRDVLEREVPNVRWRAIRRSGWPVPDDAVADLRALWQDDRANVGQRQEET